MYIKYMCFNEKASITAFSIGSVCLGYTIYKKMYIFSILYVTIVLMQLLEYYAHLALDTKNAAMNKHTAMAGFILIIIQPIIWALYVCYAHSEDKNIQNMILFMSIMFILFSVFLFNTIEKADAFRYTYLNEKCSSSICRLKWNFLSGSIIGSFVFLAFYIFLFAYAYYQVLQNKMESMTVFPVTVSLIVLSIIYMILLDKISSGKELLSGFGSIWCFLCVFIGPLMIAFPKMAFNYPV